MDGNGSFLNSFTRSLRLPSQHLTVSERARPSEESGYGILFLSAGPWEAGEGIQGGSGSREVDREVDAGPHLHSDTNPCFCHHRLVSDALFQVAMVTGGRVSADGTGRHMRTLGRPPDPHSSHSRHHVQISELGVLSEHLLNVCPSHEGGGPLSGFLHFEFSLRIWAT